MVHLLIYIIDKNKLGLKYHANIEDTTMSDLLRQADINIEKQLMLLSDSSWQDCTDTGRSTGAYMVFYQNGNIDHCTHVPCPVAQSSADSE